MVLFSIKLFRISTSIYILFITLNFAYGSEPVCSPHLNTIGYTLPQGDITIKYGEPLSIICTIYSRKIKEWGNSSELYFQKNNATIPFDQIKVINETSILYYLEKPALTEMENYVCRHSTGEMVCMNTVSVGMAPQEVTDFGCVSQNYDNLTCSWTAPQNYVTTNYNLTFSLKGYRNARGELGCPELKKSKNKNGDEIRSCTWTAGTTPQYRQAHKIFNFNLTYRNIFGARNKQITFNHFQHVIPNKPEKLKATPVTSEVVKLTWAVPSSMRTFKEGVHHRIMYSWEGSKEWHFERLIKDAKHNDTMEYFLNNLKYGHTLYDVRVSLRAASVNPNDESMWSQNASYTFRTLDRLPERPPPTIIGSFELEKVNSTSRNIYLFWQQITEREKNGDNFTYHIECVQDSQLKPKSIYKGYAKFDNLSNNQTYNFKIWSKNIIGLSRNYSVIDVPRYGYFNKPTEFSKIDMGDGVYELKWIQPRDTIVDNYTLFWCDDVRDRPYYCDGMLNWTILDSTLSNFNKSLPTKTSVYQFAISANTRHGSSGMRWADCTILPDKYNGRIKDVIIISSNITSTSIPIKWEIDCSDNFGVISQFIVNYCPIKHLLQPNCFGNYLNKTTKEKYLNITGLIPHTTYKIEVGVIRKDGTYSLSSDPKFYNTGEGPPSDVRDFHVESVSNSSVFLRWIPPAQMNGNLQKYEICFTNKTCDVVNGDETFKEITNLESYTEYNVSIKACTGSCSRASAVSFTTEMGYPGDIEQPTLYFQNETTILISWNEPEPKRGLTDYYEVQFKSKQKYQNNTELKNTTEPQYKLVDCGDSGRYNTFYLKVRGVNIINNVAHEGPWSRELEAFCEKKSNTLLIIILSSIVIFAMFAFFFGGKQFYLWCKTMRDVEVKLPPGMAPNIDLTDCPKKHAVDIDRHPPPDEELLLEKLPDRHMSGDSSGCSSAHDSVTSSLQSTAHLSSSDSGTEQPRTPSNEDLRRNSLRQRNVAAKPITAKPYITISENIPPTNNWQPSAGNYCVLGVNPSSPDSEKSYSPILLEKFNLNPYISNTESMPYVMTGEVVKPANPGYVQLPPDNPTTNASGYVVAGTKPFLMDCDKTVVDSPYVQAGTDLTFKKADFPWQQPLDHSPKTAGYVSVGDAPPPAGLAIDSKAYVPIRQFEAKALKED